VPDGGRERLLKNYNKPRPNGLGPAVNLHIFSAATSPDP